MEIMALALEIKCVKQENGAITHVGIGEHTYTVENIVGDIRNNRFQYYTFKDGKKADVYAKEHPTSKRWFLTTDPDDTRENNLDFLPKCQ